MMKKIFLLLFAALSINVFSQSYYSLIQEDENKFLVSYDTTADGGIKVNYTPSDNYFNSLMNELKLVQEEIDRIEIIILLHERKLKTLLGKKNKLIKLRDAQ